MAKVLKARYFRQTDFMEAKVGSNPSFIWRSILWDRQILQYGTRWRVGSGDKIQVMASRWIPRPITFRSIFTSSLPANINVPELIDTNHQWNGSLIDQHFAKEDAEIIKRIPLPRSPHRDELLWHYDKKGKYTVKNGYQLAFKLKFTETPTSSTKGSHDWHTKWNLNPPRKIKVFLWRATKNVLPTSENLSRRKILEEPVC